MSHCCLHRKLHLRGGDGRIEPSVAARLELTRVWASLPTHARVLWRQVPWCCGELIRLGGLLLGSPGSRGRLWAGSRGSPTWTGGCSSGAGWWVFLSRSRQRDPRTGAQWSPFPCGLHARSGPWLSVPSGYREVLRSPWGGWSRSAWSPRGGQPSLGLAGQSQSPCRGPFWGLRSSEAGPPETPVSHCAGGCTWPAGACLRRGAKFCTHAHPSHADSGIRPVMTEVEWYLRASSASRD